MPREPFDACVVGLGSLGSAAARHLAQRGARVVGVGPGEIPKSEWGRRSAFGARYDEGRITSKIDLDSTWASLARKSLDSYPGVEEAGKVKFFHEVGHLFVGQPDSRSFQARWDCAQKANIWVGVLEHDQLEETFPFFSFPEGCEGLWEANSAGWVSVRGQVKANIAAAEKHGAVVIPEIVEHIEEVEGGGFLIRMESGEEVAASKVLVASGGFTNFQRLIPDIDVPRSLKESGQAIVDIKLRMAQVLKAELGKQDISQLSGMPSMTFSDGRSWCQILPPIKYPDGKVYLTLDSGRFDGNSPESGKMSLNSYEDAVEWYRSGGSSLCEKENIELITRLFPNISPLKYSSEPSTSIRTVTGHAYCGLVSKNLGVLLGGNGFSCKASSTLGAMGAGCILSESGWDHEMHKENFLPRFRSKDTGDSFTVVHKGDPLSLLARSWTEAAPGYEQLLGLSFVPWINETVDLLGEALEPSCSGSIFVPACGPGLELELLLDMFEAQERHLVGVDISEGMIKAVKDRYRKHEYGNRIHAIVGDATNPPPSKLGKYAAVYSSFGLQQFPDPIDAVKKWTDCVGKWGVVVICFWPSRPEEKGPWRLCSDIMSELSSGRTPRTWEEDLVEVAHSQGMEILKDYYSQYEIVYRDFNVFWETVVKHGFLRATLMKKGTRFMQDVQDEIRKVYGTGEIRHSPKARVVVMIKTPNAGAKL